MKYIPMFLSILAAVVFVNCSNENINPVESNDHLNKRNPAPAALKSTSNFNAHLKGSEEVPPVDTKAQGEAIFRLSEDGNSLYYKLIASNINNILMAHIHLAPAGSNGGIVVWLYPDAPPAQLIPGRFDGILAEGTITDSDLIGALAGMTLADLLNNMTNGNAYVNVHTSQNPTGEIRGQIK